MKHISTLLAVVAFAATLTPQITNASPSAPPKSELRPPAHLDVTPDFDLAAQMFCVTGWDVAAPVTFAILRPDDASQAPQPQLIAILTRREAARLHRSADTPVRFISV